MISARSPIVAFMPHARETFPDAGRGAGRGGSFKTAMARSLSIGACWRSPGFSRLLILLVLAPALAGCAARPGPGTLDPVANRTVAAKDITIFAATDRSTAGSTPSAFGGGRGALSYEQFTMQEVGPAADKEGPSALARETDPSKDFITVGRKKLNGETFEKSVNRMRRTEADTVVVFVHGYNNSYQEAVFRLAQLRAEAGTGVVPVLFSWPSQGDFRGYVADRDSTTYARDDLVQLLTTLSRSRPEGRVAVLGHSMGAWLVMEALRQLRLQGRDDVIARLQVGLASPILMWTSSARRLRWSGGCRPR